MYGGRSSGLLFERNEEVESVYNQMYRELKSRYVLEEFDTSTW
jgi:hypothetical protein